MQKHSELAAKLRSTRGAILVRAIETIRESELPNLDEAENVLDALLEAVVSVFETDRIDAFASWLQQARDLEYPREAMVQAVVFGICSQLQAVSGDRRAAFARCEELKRIAHDALAGDFASDDERPSEAMTAVMVTLKARDVATCSHSHATASWARRLASAMKLSKSQAETIEAAALLHDVGKIATPDAVLLKEGPLTPDEWIVMRDHAAAGEKLLLQIPSLARYAHIVRAHHERVDGRGYPDGLLGHEIPFEARVIAVVDSFHAMISARPYRKPLSPRVALETLRNGSGSQWEPAIVNAMVALVERVPQTQKLATGTSGH